MNDFVFVIIMFTLMHYGLKFMPIVGPIYRIFLKFVVTPIRKKIWKVTAPYRKRLRLWVWKWLKIGLGWLAALVGTGLEKLGRAMHGAWKKVFP